MFHPFTSHKDPYGEQRYSSILFQTSALEGGEGSASRPGSTLPTGKDPVPIVQEAGGASGPVWTGAENLASTGIRSPDRPARRLSLYRPTKIQVNFVILFRSRSAICTYCTAKLIRQINLFVKLIVEHIDNWSGSFSYCRIYCQRPLRAKFHQCFSCPK